MNAIEQALARSAKREARKVLTIPKKEVIEVPKEKPKVVPTASDAVIRVVVQCPSGTHEFAYIKRNVAANVAPSRMTRNELNKMFLQGFVPLLGHLDEFPSGG